MGGVLVASPRARRRRAARWMAGLGLEVATDARSPRRALAVQERRT
jgi:hypothetical protein